MSAIPDRLEARMIAHAAEQGIPLSGSLELSPLCNMNCDMCYVRLSKQEQQAQGRLRTVEEWLRLAGELKAAGTVFLLLTGGEPLLYPGFRKLYLRLQAMGFILTINTNGTLLDETMADFLAANRPRRVNVTLYGCSEETYQRLCHYGPGYTQAVKAIRLLRQRGVDVKVNGSLVRENRTEAEDLLALAERLDAVVNIDTYMYPAVRERGRPYDLQARLTPEQAAEARVLLYKKTHPPYEFRQLAEETLAAIASTVPGDPNEECIRCQAGRSSFTISWQGYLRPCVMQTAPGYPVFELGFAGCWLQLKQWTEQARLCPDCAGCQYRTICSRCAASCLHESGSLTGKPEYLCRMSRHYVALLREAAAEGHRG